MWSNCLKFILTNIFPTGQFFLDVTGEWLGQNDSTQWDNNQDNILLSFDLISV